jgi:hypothetical protein
LYLKLAIKFCTLEEIHRHQTAFFWMFFVVTQYEMGLKSNAMPIKKNKSSKKLTVDFVGQSWLSRKLAEFAKAMGIVAWAEGRQVLQQFLYTDHHGPHGETWYEATMREAMRPRLVQADPRASSHDRE